MGWLSRVLLAACILASAAAAEFDQNLAKILSQALNLQQRAADLEPEKIEYRPEWDVMQWIRSEDQLEKRVPGDEMLPRWKIKKGKGGRVVCYFKICSFKPVYNN